MKEFNEDQTVVCFNLEPDDIKAFTYIMLELMPYKDIIYQGVNSWGIEDTEIFCACVCNIITYIF